MYNELRRIVILHEEKDDLIHLISLFTYILLSTAIDRGISLLLYGTDETRRSRDYRYQISRLSLFRESANLHRDSSVAPAQSLRLHHTIPVILPILLSLSILHPSIFFLPFSRSSPLLFSHSHAFDIIYSLLIPSPITIGSFYSPLRTSGYPRFALRLSPFAL